MKQTVVVGMSGGVDSSVAAILLKEQGYHVIGLFMRNWDSLINNDTLGNPNFNENICPQEQDYNDALNVCQRLGIELHRVDFVKEYWDYVFTYFLSELKKGRTPNPDIMCNKYIKFDLFIKEAKKLGANYVATGHYAIINDGRIYKSLDKSKDQTYFLSYLTSKQLENVMFPVGKLLKSEVRQIAKKYKLDVSTKKDSTGICFIGERNFRNFLHNYLPAQPGDIVNIETNERVGEHEGLMYYTVGQRRGLNIGGMKDKLYIVGKSLEKNILYVCLNDNNQYLYSDEAIIENVNLITSQRPTECYCKFRYRQMDIPCKLEYFDNNYVKVKYMNVKSVTPGQFCVFYKNEECLGGGMIKEVRKNNQKLWYL